MAQSRTARSARPPRPLDPSTLQALALHYVGRYATTRAKLIEYLQRKLRERGWADEVPPPVEAIADRCVASGYVDDAAFAQSKAQGLSRRGYGERRIASALHAAGIDKGIAETLRPDADSAFESAETFARRRRIGPFAAGPGDERTTRRHFAAMLRAGHSFELARHFTQPSQNTDMGDKI